MDAELQEEEDANLPDDLQVLEMNQDLALNPAADLLVPHPDVVLPEAHLQLEAAAPEADEPNGLRR